MLSALAGSARRANNQQEFLPKKLFVLLALGWSESWVIEWVNMYMFPPTDFLVDEDPVQLSIVTVVHIEVEHILNSDPNGVMAAAGQVIENSLGLPTYGLN